MKRILINHVGLIIRTIVGSTPTLATIKEILNNSIAIRLDKDGRSRRGGVANPNHRNPCKIHVWSYRVIHCEELLPLSSEEEQITVNYQVGISKLPVAATHKNSFQVVNKILLIFNQNYVRTLNKLRLLIKA